MSDPEKHRTVNGADGAPDPEDPGDGPGNGSRFGIGRRRTRAEERIESLDATPSALTAELEEARARIAALEQELADATAARQRAAADYQNLRRRTEQERAELAAFAGESILRKLLPVADDLERAVALAPDLDAPAAKAWVDGVVAIERKLQAVLAAAGVTPIQALGLPLDPTRHEAIIHEPTTTAPDGSVVRELQRGYEIGGRVLRPALVAVADNATPSGD
jgi:molecular chaperone GrpE